jgi:phenylalanyl-tRNA synthetase beta chain
MKFTLNWLKDHLETTATVEEISVALTALGLEVEEIIDHAAALQPFIVAEIKEAVTHPNADRLRVCQVYNGTEMLQVVCGAPNARAGIKVALAQVGVVIPTNQLVIRQSKIREVESCGMLCSATELGLGTDSEGIIELAADAVVGESIVKTLMLDDPVFHIAITPNRPDCLGVRGVARDLAAAGIGTLKPLKKTQWQAVGDSTITVILDDVGCPEFIGCHLQNVSNAPSPAWLQQRLKAIGLRPISALVDITNYVSFDLARPLHVYDAAKLRGNLRVRASRAGEQLAALNDKLYDLPNNAVAIADDSGVIGLGGIIGGTSTACDLNTTEVFLEVAMFDPARIARTGRDLQIISDARYRFERGIDPAFLEEAAHLAVQMIVELCGGTASALTHAGQTQPWQRNIPFNAEKINHLAGFEISAARQCQILNQLGFTFAADNRSLTPPSWRADVEGEADVAEEILRVFGYDNIPVQYLQKPDSLKLQYQTPLQQAQAIIRKTLALRGLTETCTWSFLSSHTAKLFGGSEEATLKLANPISSDLDQMRPSLLPNLIDAATRNAARSQRNLALFEQGLQFSGLGMAGQQQMAAGLRVGQIVPRSSFHTERAVDVFDAKADALAVIEATGFDAAALQIHAVAPAWYHPNRAGSLMLGKQVIAVFGELHPALLKAMDAPERMVGFEVFLEKIPQINPQKTPQAAKRKTTTRPALEVSDYQPIERDFAFVVDAELPAQDLLRSVKNSDKTLIQSATIFDIYQGKGVAEGKKSLALTVTAQAKDKTLNEQEIDLLSKKIVDAAMKLGAVLRG